MSIFYNIFNSSVELQELLWQSGVTDKMGEGGGGEEGRGDGQGRII